MNFSIERFGQVGKDVLILVGGYAVGCIAIDAVNGMTKPKDGETAGFVSKYAGPGLVLSLGFAGATAMDGEDQKIARLLCTGAALAGANKLIGSALPAATSDEKGVMKSLRSAFGEAAPADTYQPSWAMQTALLEDNDPLPNPATQMLPETTTDFSGVEETSKYAAYAF